MLVRVSRLFNPYMYVDDNPVNRVDPSGTFDPSEAPVIGRWIRGGEDLFDENEEADEGLTGCLRWWMVLRRPLFVQAW